MSEEVYLIVVPEDGLCEGCGEPLGDDPCETDDMVVVCRACYEDCCADMANPADDGYMDFSGDSLADA